MTCRRARLYTGAPETGGAARRGASPCTLSRRADRGKGDRGVTAKRTLLVTGASGYIAERLLPELRRRYALRLVDVRDRDRRGRRGAGGAIARLPDTRPRP